MNACMKPTGIMLDMDRAKAFQSASWQTGGSQSPGAGVSFPDMLREAGGHAQQGAGARESSRVPEHGSGQGAAEAGQSGTIKNGGTSKAGATHQSSRPGLSQAGGAGKSSPSGSAENKGHSGSGMSDPASSGKERTAGLSGPMGSDGGKGQASFKNKSASSKGQKDAGLAGTIGKNLAAQGFLHLNVSQGKKKTEKERAASDSKDPSGSAILSGAGAASSGRDKKMEGPFQPAEDTAAPRKDASLMAGSVLGFGAPSATGSVPSGNGKEKETLSAPGPAVPSGKINTKELAGAEGPSVGQAKMGIADLRAEGRTNKVALVAAKFPGPAADAEKNKDAGLGDALRTKDLDGAGKKGDIKPQEDNDKGQKNGFAASTAKETGKQGAEGGPGGQENSKPSIQTGGSMPGQEGPGETAGQGKFAVSHGAEDAKDVQNALKDAGKGSGPSAALQGSQAPDRGVSPVPASGNSTTNADPVSGRLQTGTAKEAAPAHAEPFVVTKQADNSIEVRIEPEGLGKMDIKLYMDKGHLNAHINASEPAAKEVIEGHLGDIASKLSSEGINVGSFSVSLRNRRNGGQQNSFSDGRGRSDSETEGIKVEQAGQKIKEPAVAGGSLLSLFA